MSGLDSRFRRKRKICVCWPCQTKIVCFRAILGINFCGKGQDLVKQSTKSSFLVDTALKETADPLLCSDSGLDREGF